jgi:hypothetical protein
MFRLKIKLDLGIISQVCGLLLDILNFSLILC